MANTHSHSAVTIALPSLIHRIGREQVRQLQTFAAQHQCQVKRVRRSRHWQCQGENENILALLETIRHSSAALALTFVSNKLEQGMEPYRQATQSDRLAGLIHANPAMTLAQLVQQTGCSLAEARAARDAQMQ